MPASPRITQGLYLLVLGLALAGLAACGGPKPLALTIQGTPGQNSPEGAQGNAVIVRVFELANETNFRNATLETFWSGSDDHLGNELLDSQQFLLYPDSTKQLRFDPSEEVQYIGVAANFRAPDREQWRWISSVADLRGKQVEVQVVQDRVQVDVRER